ncbi:MAG: M48 family metalloprotease [Nanoarchaeota archaeon]|nr:M48 family metalloprotease [Nanoarchaeota archaeon]
MNAFTVMTLGLTLWLMFGAVGFFLAGTIGLLAAAGMTAGLLVLAYVAGPRYLLWTSKAVPLDDPVITELAARQALNRHIEVPRLYFMDSNLPNAFSVAWSRDRSSIALTTGLMEQLDDHEIEAVLAHEIEHIATCTTVARNVVAFLTAPLSAIASRAFVYGYLKYRNTNKQKGLLSAIAALLIVPFAAILVHITISPKDTFKADYRAMLVLQYPDSLASAIRKINKKILEQPSAGGNANAHMWFANPFGRSWFNQFFVVHPSADNRIDELMLFYD